MLESEQHITSNGSGRNSLEPSPEKNIDKERCTKSPNNLKKCFKYCCYVDLSKRVFVALCSVILCVSAFGYLLFFRFYIHEANIWSSLRAITKQVQTIQSKIEGLDQKYNELKDIQARFDEINKKFEDRKIHNNNNYNNVQMYDFIKLKNEVSVLSKKIMENTNSQCSITAVDRPNKPWYERLKDLFKYGVSVSNISDKKNQ